MMVTFVSQCEKKSLKKTRRVLDAFANRIGDNTWQTVITEDGLAAVKKLLRKTVSKNTAVSCHWLRSRARSELVWIVGNKKKFNHQGLVPVNSTGRNLLNTHVENDWHYLPLIKALTALAALFHDWGKASQLFQKKLKSNKNSVKGDPIRHEWISVLLLSAFVQSTEGNDDKQWLSALARGEVDETQLKKIAIEESQKPMSGLPPIAQLVTWLIVSHHRLPLTQQDYRMEKVESLTDMLTRITKEWGYENKRFEPESEKQYQSRLAACFKFPDGLISNSKTWMKEIKKWSQRLLDNETHAKQSIEDGCYRLILNHARLCLMLGDHYYSSQDANKHWRDNTGLFANTDRASKQLKQKLDEHLVGVAKNALTTAHLLPSFEKEPPIAEDIQSLRARSPSEFKWQDKAVEQINSWQRTTAQETKQKYGFFAVNMASTGCGKTYANAKIIRALSNDNQSLRFVLALGLRTLTLQTGDEYRQRVGLDDSELAVLIGSRAVLELHQQNKIDLEKNSDENTGSASQESLLDEDIDFDCALPEQKLSTVLTCERDKKFLYAPVLACTIDHLMAATETKRGGRYILPTLRLMSSDLVIDEIDDFTGNDLIAIGRLIHLAGMLGRKVMISSATIPPYMAEGYFKAYRDGWQLYCKTRDASNIIGCAWIDEFSTHVESNKTLETLESIKQYRQSHELFIKKRISKLNKQPAKRKADITDCQSIIDAHEGQSHQQTDVIESKQQAYFNLIAKSALEKHEQHHFTDQATQIDVSFGVVRMANISPCVALSQYLLEKDWPEEAEVRVMAYHSQQVLLMRSVQEQHLDTVLKRKEKNNEKPHALKNSVIRQHLDISRAQSSKVKNMLFILVATPVEEVGRDHDFDWAIIEPSSYRSIIQLAGRVKRHREGEVGQPNISILQYNWKGLKNLHLENSIVFNRPGYEDRLPLKSHNIRDLIYTKTISQRLDAVPRISMSNDLNATYFKSMNQAQSLVELEHAATWWWLASYKEATPHSLNGYLNRPWFLTALPQTLAPFRRSEPTLKIFLTFDNRQQEYKFCEKDEQGDIIDRESILNIQRHQISDIASSRLWLKRDFDQSCEHIAEQQLIRKRIISIRYGELNFPHNENTKYVYNDQLGLVKI